MTDIVRAASSLFRMSWQAGRGKLAVALLLMLAQATALPLSAYAVGRMTEDAGGGRTAAAVVDGLCVAVLTIAALTAGHFAHLAYFELGELNFLALNRRLMWLSNGSEGIAHHENAEHADRVQVLRQELNRVTWTGMQALLSSVSLTLAITITSVLLGSQSVVLLLLWAAAVPPLLIGRRAEAVLSRARRDAAEPTRMARHVFTLATDGASAKELRTCRLQEEMRRRHQEQWRRASAVLARAELRATLLRIAGQLVFGVSYVGATLLIIRQTVAGEHRIGAVVLVIVLAAQVNQQVTTAVTLLQELQRLADTMGTLRWVDGIVAPGPAGAAEPVQGRPAPRRIEQGIRLRDVTFRYPGTDHAVLQDVDLFLPAGSTVAVVGENGAGKSTLAKLLCRFYLPSTGRIEVDGVDLTAIAASDWRAGIAAGFQDFARLEFTARCTVGVGDLPRRDSDAAVLAALGRARAESVIDQLEAGLDTRLGHSHPDGGVDLSGGQWQKLSLGRAMMRQDPLLLVLDEPTSALDAETEHHLFEQYAAGAKRVAAATGGITLLISHRFSTVQMADLILVVDQGRVAEAGSHRDLMNRHGIYRSLYSLQASGYR